MSERIRELTDDDRKWLARFPQTCDEDVTRQDESQPCELPAVAARYDVTSGTFYAVCARHTRAPMAALADLLASLAGRVSA